MWKSWSHTRSISGTNLIFPFTFIKVWRILIQNDIYFWIKTTAWIKVEEFPQCKFYNNIGDLSIRSFRCHSNDTKRNPWVILCSHCPINDSFRYLHNAVTFTLQLCYKPLGMLQRVTKSQKVHISSHDGLEKLHNINFVWHRSQSFPEKEQSSRNFPFPNQIFWTKNTPLWLTIRIPSNDQKEHIVNNFKKLDNVHWNATTIHQYL